MSKSSVERVNTKMLIAVTDNRTGCAIYLKDTEQLIAKVRFYRNSSQALNGEILKKIMRALESYMREANRNALENSGA